LIDCTVEYNPGQAAQSAVWPFTSTDDVPGGQTRRPAGTNRLFVPPVRLTTVGSWAFPVAATQVRNSLPEHIVSAPTLQSFRRPLKTFFSTAVVLLSCMPVPLHGTYCPNTSLLNLTFVF